MCKPCLERPAVQFTTPPSYEQARALFDEADRARPKLPEHHAGSKGHKHRGQFQELPIRIQRNERVRSQDGFMRLWTADGLITIHAKSAIGFDGLRLKPSRVRESLPAT